MYIHELLNNPEFNFNAPVRILKVVFIGSSFTAFGRFFYSRGRADTPGPQFVGNLRVT